MLTYDIIYIFLFTYVNIRYFILFYEDLCAKF